MRRTVPVHRADIERGTENHEHLQTRMAGSVTSVARGSIGPPLSPTRTELPTSLSSSAMTSATGHHPLQLRHDGLPHAQIRPHCERRRDLHRRLWTAILYRGARGVHHWSVHCGQELLKVGLPGAKEGSSGKDSTIADLLKPQGYATGQFGKKHLRSQRLLPTVHGLTDSSATSIT